MPRTQSAARDLVIVEPAATAPTIRQRPAPRDLVAAGRGIGLG